MLANSTDLFKSNIVNINSKPPKLFKLLLFGNGFVCFIRNSTFNHYDQSSYLRLFEWSKDSSYNMVIKLIALPLILEREQKTMSIDESHRTIPFPNIKHQTHFSLTAWLNDCKKINKKVPTISCFISRTGAIAQRCFGVNSIELMNKREEL